MLMRKGAHGGKGDRMVIRIPGNLPNSESVTILLYNVFEIQQCGWTLSCALRSLPSPPHPPPSIVPPCWGAGKARLRGRVRSTA